MAGNYPFHGKLHRSTHHTTPTPGIIESGTDPVAGPSSKFQGIFFTQNEGNSSDWYSAYTTLNANSAYWVSVYTTVYANSSKWESTYTSLNANSGKYESTYTTVAVNSGDWESVYSTVQSLSDSWEESIYITPLQAASASWDSVYSTTNTNSSYWSEAYTNLVTNSSVYLSGGSAGGVTFNPITTTDYFSGRITPLTLPDTNVQGALSALHDRLNGLYALLNGLTATNGTLFVSICSTP